MDSLDELEAEFSGVRATDDTTNNRSATPAERENNVRPVNPEFTF
jgi:hypothetical protein